MPCTGAHAQICFTVWMFWLVHQILWALFLGMTRDYEIQQLENGMQPTRYTWKTLQESRWFDVCSSYQSDAWNPYPKYQNPLTISQQATVISFISCEKAHQHDVLGPSTFCSNKQTIYLSIYLSIYLFYQSIYIYRHILQSNHQQILCWNPHSTVT